MDGMTDRQIDGWMTDRRIWNNRATTDRQTDRLTSLNCL